MSSFALPTGSYSFSEPKASVRRLVNCFAEAAPQLQKNDNKTPDQWSPVILRRGPGIGTFSSISTDKSPVRGMWLMLGVLYAVVGSNLYKISSTGKPTLIGTGIGGVGRVYMADNTACLVIIIPGTVLGYTYTTTNGFATITDPIFLQFGALNLGFIDSYIVFLATNGREFYNCDPQSTSGQGPITFTPGTEFPREFGTDLFVGMGIDHRTINIFGQLTSEVFIDAGNTTNTPFAAAPQNFIELGCAAGNTICKQDQTLFWLANDKTVRRKNGVTPQRVSNNGIEAVLDDAIVSDAYAFPYTLGGHLCYVLTLPSAGRTLVYDVTTTEWHEMSSSNTPAGAWRPFCAINAYGKQLVGDSLTGQIGYLDMSVFSEFGDTMVAEWIHQPVYKDHNRLRHNRAELIMSTGMGPLGGQGSVPLITMKISDDGGHLFRTMPLRSLGLEGHYQDRVVWYRLGMGRDRVYKFVLSDPLPMWNTDFQIEVQPGMH